MPEIKKQAFYDSKWGEWNDMIYYSPAPRLRRSKIISWIKPVKLNSLLDVGCGNGEFLSEVYKVKPGVKLSGADISLKVVEANRSKMPGAHFFHLDLNNETVPARFDAVICMEVVEHCDDYREAIKRLADMTDKWLMITVPCGPLFEIDRRVGHTRHFKAEEISSALKNCGLKIIKIQRWGFPFFNIYKHAINISPDKMSEAFLSSSKYGIREKVISSATYAAFKLCLPWWGYQLFVMASR